MPIQLFVPTFDIEACLQEIRECLEKGWTGLGYKTVQLEDMWKQYTGLPHAHFISSNTAGLEMSFELLKKHYEWKDGDEVITTPITFVSSNHAILHNNLKPIFADVDEKNLTLDPDDVAKKITKKTKAILFVGIGGNVGNYYEIVEIAKKHKLAIILDAAHMSGTRYKGVTPGMEADVIVYSFQAVKNLPTGDSGMICFKEPSLDVEVRKLSWLGINKDTYARTNDKGSYKWHYDVEYVGWKYNGSAIMAAIAIAQMPHLDRDNAYRRQIASWYDDAFKGNKAVKIIEHKEKENSARHLYQIVVDSRDEMMLYLNQLEIYPGVHYRDNTEYSMYAYAKGTCPKGQKLSEQILTLPLHMRLSYQDIQEIAKAINDFTQKKL
jgi:dTDP-4-amino-4,6-dideoxygalactose transaminase